jgi:2-hydroxychromene-2-carboxylate isomerase
MNHAPPAADTTKGRYVWRDVARSAEFAGLPFKWPEPFPFNSLSAARIFWYLADSDVNSAVDWARAVFHASFGEGRDCSSPDVLAAVAADLGLNAQELLEATGNDAVKERLKQVTGEAMERGVFGAPTFFVGDEMFWGGDRIEQLERHISGD